jgi:hypothetical protein
MCVKLSVMVRLNHFRKVTVGADSLPILSNLELKGREFLCSNKSKPSQSVIYIYIQSRLSLIIL